MKFIDEVHIEVTSGSGGRGCMSFRREKYIPFGGPDGGNGGRGGSVYLVGDDRLNNLLELRNKRFFRAENGTHGTSKLCHGRYGDDLLVHVPLGTKVFDAETDEFIADITEKNNKVCVAVGSDGGYGNAHFKSSTNRAPRRTTTGYDGEYRKLRLELSVLADVGLLGMPNAGKSTFLRRISKATPKVADYPFTTLKPHLGVVQADYGQVFTVADIPGLISGAAHGAGLGVRFLKHLSRCNILLHIVDITASDVAANIKQIDLELQEYSDELAAKQTWLVFNKCDCLTKHDLDEKIDSCLSKLNRKYTRVAKISAISGMGTESLILDIANSLDEEL